MGQDGGHPAQPDGFGGERNLDFVVDSHPGLVDLFLTQVRQDYLRLQPLTPEEIHAEAARLLQELRARIPPQQPRHPLHGPRFAGLSGPRRHPGPDQLMALLPFRSLAITGLVDRRPAPMSPSAARTVQRRANLAVLSDAS